MPRVRRKRKARSIDLDFYQVMVLAVGWRDPLKYPFIPNAQLGYRTREDVRQAWRLHRRNPRICQWLDPDSPEYRPGRRPWAWWQFESNEPLDRTRPQHEQLAGMGVLLEHEKLDLKRKALRFRREDGFKVPGVPEDGLLIEGHPDYDPDEPKPFFLPIPEPEPYPDEVQALIDEATEQVKDEPWLYWIADQRTGQLSPADADAVLNHRCTVDLDRGWHVVDFVETFCKQSQGEWAGEYFDLLEWQKRDFLLPLFSWVRPDGTRRFREADLWISKKQGKSSLCGALDAYGAVGDGEGGPKVFNAAVTRAQCEEVYGTCVALVDASPELSRLLVPKSSKKEVHFRSGERSGGRRGEKKEEQFVIKALAAEAGSAEGKNTHYVIYDEMHVWKDRKFFAALKFGGAARRQPIKIKISTAGDDIDGVGGREYQRAKKIARGESFNFAHFVKIFEAPDGLDYNDPRVYLNPRIWELAAPSLGYTTSYQAMYEAVLASLESPSDWADFLRYLLNRWVEGGQPYIPMGAWRRCAEESFDESDLEDVEICAAGLDLAAVEDTVSFSMCFQKDDLFYFLWRFWVPEGAVEKRAKDGDHRYQNWIDEGYLFVTPGERIEQEYVYEQIGRDFSRFRFPELAFDRWGTEWLSAKLDSHFGLEVIPYSQGPRAYNYAVTQFKALLKDDRIRTGGNPVADWQAKNVVVKVNQYDEVYPIKKLKDKRFKIDGMVAAFMALDRVLRHTEDDSLYNQPRELWDPTYKKTS